MKINNVSDLVVETLQQVGVKRIYGLVGDSLNGITEAIRRRGTIDWVHVRHEEVAAFAAGAEAQLTGDLAVCAGSCGPGNLHLINGLYDCPTARERPMLAIAAHIPSPEIGTNYFPGNPAGAPVPRMQRVLRARHLEPCATARTCFEIGHPRRRSVSARRCGAGHPRRCRPPRCSNARAVVAESPGSCQGGPACGRPADGRSRGSSPSCWVADEDRSRCSADAAAPVLTRP